MFKARFFLLSLLVCAPAAAQQAEFAPSFGRYMPLYPGMYFNGGYAQDDRDSTFDQDGVERDSAAPQAGGKTSFPEKSALASFTWHFPMFESQNVTFFSSRTHLARVNLRYTDTQTEGRLAAFAADTSDDASTDADDLRNNGSGIGDLTLEFGSFLYGSKTPDWRERERTQLAVLLTIGATIPTGIYDRDAPINSGDNTISIHGQLGLHWQPWRGGFVDAGAGYREYFQNYDPEFGATAPANQGDDIFWDVSFGQRLLSGLYGTVFATRREGDPNLYENPRFAPNAPAPGNANPVTPAANDTFPTPGVYFDRGTEFTTAGLSLSYFLGQRWLLALNYSQPQSGKSGQFQLPFTTREPAGCTIPSTGCTIATNGSVLADGMGPARSYSSDRLMVTATYNFGLGDTFTCTGCKE